MKTRKIVALLLAAILVLSCAAALADTDKEIQFSGHTFGETLADFAKSSRIGWISFQDGRQPLVTRRIADPFFSWFTWMVYNQDSPVSYCINVQPDNSQEVAGHQASANMKFYFPTAEDAAAYNLTNAVFYAGTYEFYDGDAANTFEDLKKKLTSVYGEPTAESSNPDDLWGKLPFRSDINEQDAQRSLEEAMNNYNPMNLVLWQSSANGAQVVLVNYMEGGGSWSRTMLHYLDPKADEIIEGLYGSAGPVANDSVDGL
jgi:hypothetical protein